MPIEQGMNEFCPMPGCRVEVITSDDPNLLHIAAHGIRPGGRCPDCGRASRAVHSRYRRYPADLPSLGRRVHVGLRARRFYCDNTCQCSSFSLRQGVRSMRPTRPSCRCRIASSAAGVSGIR